MSKKLTEVEIQDAKRLKTIYEKRKNEAKVTGNKISQESIALECGWTQGAVGHFLNGRTALNLEAAIKFANALDVAVQDFSPSLAAKIGGSNFNAIDVVGYKEAKVINLSNVANYLNEESVLSSNSSEPYDARIHGESCFWVEINNDEMQPAFDIGDLVLIDPDLQPKIGNYVAASVGEDKVGKLRQWRNGGFDNTGIAYSQLLPTNELYPTIDSRFTQFEILGVAVEVKKKLI